MIYLIITTSINNRFGVINDNVRKDRYINCIATVLDLVKNEPEIHPIIVENNGNRDTYLSQFHCDILYTNNNTLNFTHKGGNELLDIKQAINHYNIQDEDTIIKLTGRYKPLNLNFIQTVKTHCHTHDAFVKFFNVCTLQYHPLKDDCVLGLFAVKASHLKRFEYSYTKSAECDFALYIKHNAKNIYDIRQLNLQCCFADNLRILEV